MKHALSLPTTIVVVLLVAVISSRSTAQEKVPPFAFVCFDDSSQLISSESMMGKLYLIDFWATWCPPCVEELPGLEQVYKEYKDSGFTVVSFSFDKSATQLRKFRSKRFALPWIHGWLEDGFGSNIAHLFDVQNIPHQLLVNKQGAIVAADEELRGKQLELTIRKFLHQ